MKGWKTMMPEKDSHHLMHFRKEWIVRPQAEYIRDQMIAHGLARTAHNALHAECGAVPVPGYHTLQRVARQLKPGLDIYERIDDYCDLVEESNRHPRIKPLEIDLNNISIEALRLQIPFLIDGLPSTRSIVA